MITPEEARRRYEWDLCLYDAQPFPEDNESFRRLYCSDKCRKASERTRRRYRASRPEADGQTVELAGGIPVDVVDAVRRIYAT